MCKGRVRRKRKSRTPPTNTALQNHVYPLGPGRGALSIFRCRDNIEPFLLIGGGCSYERIASSRPFPPVPGKVPSRSRGIVVVPVVISGSCSAC